MPYTTNNHKDTTARSRAVSVSVLIKRSVAWAAQKPYAGNRIKGYAMWLDRAVRTRIHAIARDYGVDENSSIDPITNCERCAKTSVPSTSAAVKVPTEKRAVGGVGG